MTPTWYFCRTCGHRGLFVAEPEHELECPECRKHYLPKAIMRRQEVEWLSKGSDFYPTKEEAG